MYGLLNNALKVYVKEKYGDDIWDLVRFRAGILDDNFKNSEGYSDKITYDLVGAVADTANTTVDLVLDGFGEQWVKYTVEQGYGQLFEVAGENIRDFLLSLNAMHANMHRTFPNLVPPKFKFDPLDPRTLRMHYESTRQGLCPMIPGLLRGLSNRFMTPLTVEEVACARNRAHHCEFIVTLLTPTKP